MFGTNFPCMRHPASRLEVIIHSRADTRNAVKSAAYTARSIFIDERFGTRFRATKKGGLLSHELINWPGDTAALWNAAERAEKRRNSRVIRELRPSLPRELPLAAQVRLVRGFCLWLRDEYGVAVQADIHAPRFLDEEKEKLHSKGKLGMAEADYLATLFDTEETNQNFHAHLLMTTRKVCPKTGEFGEKTRVLDGGDTGPDEVTRIRKVWEQRTNAALKKVGSSARVDLRSNAEMVKAGDAPEGLIRQDHLGPRAFAVAIRKQESRRKAKAEKDSDDENPLDEGPVDPKEEANDQEKPYFQRVLDGEEDDFDPGQRREAIRCYNEGLWNCWLLQRAWQREQGREAAEQIAAEREADRKRVAKAERQEMQSANSSAEVEAAMATSSQFDSVRMGAAFEHAMAWARGEQTEPPCEEPEFSSTVDLEAYEPPQAKPHPESLFQPRIVRIRGPRSR